MIGPVDNSYHYFVAIYRCDPAVGAPLKCVCDEAKVELFRDHRTYFPSEYKPAVVAAVKDAEYCFPVQSPVVLDTKIQHLVLTARTRRSRHEAQAECTAALDRVIAILTAVYGTDLFRTLLFRGWLRGGPPDPHLGVLMRAVMPIELASAGIAREYGSASTAINANAELKERFGLMSRLVARALSQPPGEEAFLWLWTAVEVFPMVGTTDIKPIGEFLATYVNRPAEIVKQKLRIGWLFGMRSRLVHDGHLPLDQEDALSALGTLELVVRAILRHAAALPHDGALDPLLNAVKPDPPRPKVT